MDKRDNPSRTRRGVIHESRKRERINDDGVFMRHQRGPITSTFTTDWFLREGEGRELLGEWMKLTSVRSHDQRRMLQANSHTFPSNDWIHKITKKKESDRYDLTTLLDRGRPVQDGERSPRTNLGSYPAHLRSLISSPHRYSQPMLVTDSWRTSTAISSRVEVLVHFGREMPPDIME